MYKFVPEFDNYSIQGNIKIIKVSVFDSSLELEHARSLRDSRTLRWIMRSTETLDFNRDYIKHPEASFYGDVQGDSMKDAAKCILDGDRVIIDRRLFSHMTALSLWLGWGR